MKTSMLRVEWPIVQIREIFFFDCDSIIRNFDESQEILR
jgi:hypothetical protein